MPNTTMVYAARKIITMNPSQPLATHVAVREGRILAVGALETLADWGPYDLDETFSDKVLMPGLVEGHSHVLEGGVWSYTYVGFYDRYGPDGTLWKGLTSIDEVVDRLRDAEARLPASEPVLAWGFDPIFFEGRRLSAADLDRVSTTRPVVVMHASFHLINVNSVVMRRAGINADLQIEGILKDSNGQPTGELQEMAAMFMGLRIAGNEFFTLASTPESTRRFGQVAQLAGVTTVTDLYNELSEDTVTAYGEVTVDARFPVRLVSAYNPAGLSPAEGVEKLRRLVRLNTDKLRFGIVKLMTDGSIQGFTARLKWPGYYNGRPNGMWNFAPQELREICAAFHKAGFQLHIHTNGDEASEVGLDTIESILSEAPRWDHRHTLQHCQMMDASQYRRLKTLGACANIFSNHIYYWGDAHYAQTLGPDRANRMDAAGTAERLGVPFAMHSDAPITPIGPLFTAWCAVNRRTASGRALGSEECISVATALHAITLGAAYTLKMDGMIGSIEVGKFADFCVLDDDPTEVEPAALKDVRIWGTILGGEVFKSPRT